MKRTLFMAGCAVTALSSAHAGIIVNIFDQANGMMVQGSGTLNITSATYSHTLNTVNAVRANAAVTPGPHMSTMADMYRIFSGFAGPTDIGPGNFTSTGNVGSGDLFGINFSLLPTQLLLLVPAGYVSGEALVGQSFHQNQSIDSVGLTPGQYTWTWGSGPDADFYTVNVAPAPGTLALLALGAACSRRRKRNG